MSLSTFSPIAASGSDSLRDRALAVAGRQRRRAALGLIETVIRDEFAGHIAVVSSFGTESAVVLAMVAEIDAATPVIFLETGKHFPETLAYRDTLARELGLRDLRDFAPEPGAIERDDAGDDLWRRDPDRCCGLRKVVPLERALAGFDAWITGRKRHQGGERASLPPVEAADGRIKINPLADWSTADVAAEFSARNLPPHPLTVQGYRSIGCAPCTRKTKDGEDPRAGRWAGTGKTECGIHRSPWF